MPKPGLRKTRPRVSVRATVKLRAYDLIADAMAGVGQLAVRRFYKHRDDYPSDEDVIALGERIDDEVMGALSEILDFGDGEL